MSHPARHAPALEAQINAARAAVGLHPLQSHPALVAAAIAHADDLISNGAFDHAGSDRSLPMARIKRAGLSPRLAAENIAEGQPDAAAAMAAWQGSPGHRDNNLHPQYTMVGAAQAVYGRRGLVTDGHVLWVAVFAAAF